MPYRDPKMRNLVTRLHKRAVRAARAEAARSLYGERCKECGEKGEICLARSAPFASPGCPSDLRLSRMERYLSSLAGRVPLCRECLNDRRRRASPVRDVSAQIYKALGVTPWWTRRGWRREAA